METKYLIYSFTGVLAYFILNKMESQLKWIAVGFAVAMLLFSIFCNEEKDKEDDNLNNKKEGNKNGI